MSVKCQVRQLVTSIVIILSRLSKICAMEACRMLNVHTRHANVSREMLEHKCGPAKFRMPLLVRVSDTVLIVGVTAIKAMVWMSWCYI